MGEVGESIDTALEYSIQQTDNSQDTTPIHAVKGHLELTDATTMEVSLFLVHHTSLLLSLTTMHM